MTDINRLIYEALADSQVHLESGLAVSATGSGSAFSDFSVAGGVIAHLSLHSIQGAPTVTVKIQHSSDNATWTDLLTFTAASADHDETVPADSPKKYLRAAWTVSGTGSCSISVDVVPTGATSLATLDARYASVSLSANTQTTSYTLVLGDLGKVVEMNVGSANTLTVPPNSSVPFPIGTVIEVLQLGAGLTTITAGLGVTIDSPSGLVLAGQYASVALRKRGTDEWTLIGDLAALTLAPGAEIGYDQITGNVTVSSSTESAGTTILTCAAHTFDGAPVMFEFSAGQINGPQGTGSAQVTLCLFEGATEIGRIIVVGQGTTGGSNDVPATRRFRFTPTVGSHTYTVTAFETGGSISSHSVVVAGSGGVGATPAFVRFTKV